MLDSVLLVLISEPLGAFYLEQSPFMAATNYLTMKRVRALD